MREMMSFALWKTVSLMIHLKLKITFKITFVTQKPYEIKQSKFIYLMSILFWNTIDQFRFTV